MSMPIFIKFLFVFSHIKCPKWSGPKQEYLFYKNVFFLMIVTSLVYTKVQMTRDTKVIFNIKECILTDRILNFQKIV